MAFYKGHQYIPISQLHIYLFNSNLITMKKENTDIDEDEDVQSNLNFFFENAAWYYGLLVTTQSKTPFTGLRQIVRFNEVSYFIV